MSGSSYAPRIQMPASPDVAERLRDGHEQYTPVAENSVGQEMLRTGVSSNADGTGADFVYCNGGVPSCTSADATYLKFDMMEGSVALSTEVNGDTVGAAVDPTWSSTDERRDVGLKGSLAASTKVGAEKAGLDVAVAASQSQQGTLTPRADGRYEASGGSALAVDVESSMNAGVANGGFSGGATSGEQSTRIFTAEEIASARAELRAAGEADSTREVVALLLATPESAADFEVGEFVESSSGGRFGAKAKGTAGVIAGGSTGGSDSRRKRIQRTEAGVVFTYTTTDAAQGSVSLGIGIPHAKTERKRASEQSTTRTLKLTLDPTTDDALIRRLQGLSNADLQRALEANGAEVLMGVGVSHSAIDTLQLGAVARTETATGTLTHDGKGFTGTWLDATKHQATVLETDAGSSGASATYRYGQGLSLTSTEDKKQNVGREVTDADLQQLVARTVADPSSFEREGTPDVSGEPVAWQSLRDALQAVSALPEEEQATAASRAIALFVAEGHDAAQLDRVFAVHQLGRVEQWPASISGGGERLAALEGDEAPTEATLVALDALRGEVAGASDYTVATAKAETLERIADVRIAVLERVLAVDGMDAEDLAFDAKHAALGAAVGRCSAYRAEEGTMYDGVGTEDNLMAYARLQRFYVDWSQAVDAVRDACRGLELPSEVWMVSADGENRVEAYEPTLERARGLHAEHGGMDGDFDDNIGRGLS